MTTEPLISCLCLTMPGRKAFFHQALKCYYAQTWPNKMLTVVTDNGYGVWCDGIQNVTFDERFTIGQKRNLGCSSVLGEYIAIWDDDDYYAPRRLEAQYQALQSSGKAVCTIRSAPFKQGSEWFGIDPANIKGGTGIGSSLFFKRSWWQSRPFAHTDLAEDQQFKDAALRDGQLHVLDDPKLMYVNRHAGNTWQQPMPGPGYVRLEGFQWTE